MQVIEKKVYVCPKCGTGHPDEEAALACARAGEWLERFDEKSLLWKWVILRNSHGSVMAYIPEKIDRRYDWAGEPRCLRRRISVFNSFSNSFANITPSDTEYCGEWLIAETLGIGEGYEKYGLVPPLSWLRGAPEEVRREAGETLEKALLARKAEIRAAFSGDADIMENLLAAYSVPDFGNGERPPVSMDAMPDTRLAHGHRLLELEKHVDAFRKESDA